MNLEIKFNLRRIGHEVDILKNLGSREKEPFSNSNKESLSPTTAVAVYIDEANPMPRNWEKEE